jgi:hypothetical protein
MVAIRTTATAMEIPIARHHKALVSDDYLQWILAIANEKFHANQAKTDKLYHALRRALFPPRHNLHPNETNPHMTSTRFNRAPNQTSISIQIRVMPQVFRRTGHVSVWRTYMTTVHLILYSLEHQSIQRV